MTKIGDQQMQHLAPCSFIAEQHEQDMLEELDKMHEECHALREDGKASLLSVTHASHSLDCHFENCIYCVENGHCTTAHGSRLFPRCSTLTAGTHSSCPV